MVWGSKLKSTVAHSTEEAEYMAICVVVQEALFLRQILAHLDHAPSGSTRMLEDNNGCKAMATIDMTTTKSKHIDIRYHFIRDVVKSKAVVVRYYPTGDMLADDILPSLLSLHVYTSISLAKC